MQVQRASTQILSLYAYRYSTDTLRAIWKTGSLADKAYETHAREHSQTATLVKETRHCGRLDMVKVEHFIQFIDCPYFYQVAVWK